MEEESESYNFPLAFIPIVPYKTCKIQVQKNNGSSPVIFLTGRFHLFECRRGHATIFKNKLVNRDPEGEMIAPQSTK